MIGLTIQQIKSKILASEKITEEELNSKIKTKLEQLSGLISEEGAAHIIANELGIKLIQAEGGKLKINDVAQGMRSVDVTGKITRLFELRNFQSGGRNGKVASFILSDETNSIRITLWNEQAEIFNNLKEGDILRVKNGYVRNNNGRAEIHLNANSKTEINPEGISITPKESKDGYAKPTRKKLNELKENDQNIELLGTIVQVYDIRFFESCAECNKRLINKEGIWSCPTHGQVNPDYNYVMNTFIDDGTDSIRTTFWKRQIQSLLSKSDEEIQTFRTDPSSFEPLKTELLGNIVKLVGNTRMNQQMNSLEFTANLVFNNPDPNDELKKIKKEVITQNSSINSSTITEQKVEAIVNQELDKVNKTESVIPATNSTVSDPTIQNSSDKLQQAMKEDFKENGVQEAPIIEQKPTPKDIAFETPVTERMDKSGLDNDLVSIEDLEDLEELDNI